MPSGLIEQEHCGGAPSHGGRDLREMQRHGFGIAKGQHQPGALALVRADGAKDIGRLRPLVLGCRWPRAAPRSAARDLVLLIDARFVLPPQLFCGCHPWCKKFRIQVCE